jgi:hypothetical protein
MIECIKRILINNKNIYNFIWKHGKKWSTLTKIISKYIFNHFKNLIK